MRRYSIGSMTVTCLLVMVLAATAAYGGRKKQAPDTHQAQLAFGVKMAQRGLWSEALFRFKQAERLSPGDPRILNNMAVAYEALGNFEKALDYYQNAIKSDPTNRDLKRNYSRFVEFYRAFKPDGSQQGAAGERPPQTASAPSGP